MKTQQQLKVGGREITLSNAGKVYFPEDGTTKGEVVAFYASIADTILPHLKNRPLTLKRYPDGVTSEPFYEKNAPMHTPSWVKRVAVRRSEGVGEVSYILCNDIATLLWACNLGDIEKHVFLAKTPKLHCPTSVVFDLDPGEGADILDCGVVALRLKEIFDSLKLQSFIKVSGSKGLHLTVPLNTAVTYEKTQPFAKAIADLLVQEMPDRVVSAMAVKLRRHKVLIDWSQNSEHKTTVCVYAMRAKHGTPFISLPITWEELAKAVKKRSAKTLFFSPAAAIKRIQKHGDFYAPVLKLKQKIPAAFSKALASGPAPKLSHWPSSSRGKTKSASAKKTPKSRSISARDKDKSLREYAAKRDHSQTPEPVANKRGKGVSKTAAKSKSKGKHKALHFVIQKHDASHLHYDWRLEMQGVLRSWAVPKGPPLTPREARLAMHVEDHPMAYADFEGTIPEGNYGAGTVMVWDHGTYEDITGNAAAAYHQGKMHVVLHGKKLKGEWIMVKDRRDDDGHRWLLIKAGTAQKLTAKADNTSATSGRTMKQIAKANDRQWKSGKKAGGGSGTRHVH